MDKLESYMRSPDLVSGINYNVRNKNSFFTGIHDWAEQRNTPVSVRVLNPLESFYVVAKKCFEHIIDPFDDIPYYKKFQIILAGGLNLPVVPIGGAWIYDFDNREIIRGWDIQRTLTAVMQTDLLVHEYLHCYQHLLHDQLKEEGAITVDHKTPSSVVEPPLFGFNFHTPSKKWMKRFENKILKRLAKLQATCA